MILIAVAFIWIPVTMFVYHWVGYPLLLLALSRSRRGGGRAPETELPSLSVVVAVRNEEMTLPAKIANCLDLDYPSDRLEVVFASDASDDGSDRLLAAVRDPKLRWTRLDRRGGKASALNRLFEVATGELVLITDADILLARDSARRLAARFADPRVGVVQCNYVRTNSDGSAAEGVFDRWETRVKLLEGYLYAMPTANGMGMMLRRSLCRSIPADTIHDDLLLGIRPFREGYGAVFESGAVATCRVESEGIELHRRIKMGRGNIQALARNFDLLSPKYGYQALSFFSHKILRTILPFTLPFILAGSVLGMSHPFCFWFLMVQVACYATVPLLLLVRGRWRRLLLPQYFLLMNIALLVGSVQYVFGRKKTLWERTARG